MYILKYIRHFSLICCLKNEWCLLVIVHVEDFEGGITLCVGKQCVAFTVLSILSRAVMRILVILMLAVVSRVLCFSIFAQNGIFVDKHVV